MMTVVVEEVVVIVVIAVFAWLVPVRRNGIPGLRGRGQLPARPVPDRARMAASVAASATETQPGCVRPRPVPADERISAGRDRERDASVLAELDRTWDAGYADRVAATMRERRHPR